jgi:pimeloyl-ACP methyl ester carboxylesterase
MPDGRIVPDYDPAIVSGPPSEVDPWWVFERLAALPLLVLRGELSDLLGVETVRTMELLHPGMRAVDIPGRGHAPLLNEPAAVESINAFLEEVDQGRQAS